MPDDHKDSTEQIKFRATTEARLMLITRDQERHEILLEKYEKRLGKVENELTALKVKVAVYAAVIGSVTGGGMSKILSLLGGS